MGLGSLARVFIKGRDPHDYMGLSQALGHQVAATARAEMPQLAGRGLEAGQPFEASGPAKMLTFDPGRRGEWRRMGLATGMAMTMADRHVEAVDFIGDGLAQATAVECGHGVFLHGTDERSKADVTTVGRGLSGL